MISKFMIGMYGGFDNYKYKRDFRKGFYGIEACLFKDERDIHTLASLSKNEGFYLGVHFPLRAGILKLRDPLFLSLDADTRADAYKHIQKELEYIRRVQINVDYVLFHYPTPVILNTDFNMSRWRFAESSEYMFESECSFDEFKTHSEYLFNWLTEKSLDYGFTPVLELDALNRYICEDNFLEALLDKYHEVKICLDTGRLHLQNKNDPHFNDIDIIKRFAKYAEVVHLWTVNASENPENNHIPALPDLKPEDGWTPVEQYMREIIRVNKHVKIMFEHRSELISDEELNGCYSWISSIADKHNKQS